MDRISSRKKKIMVLALVLVLLAGTVSIVAYFYRQQKALAEEQNGLHLTGTVEALTVMAAFKIPGRIDSIMVEEGDEVTAGQELAVLDKREMEARFLQAQGACEAAQGQLAQAEAAIPLTSEQVEAKIGQARAVMDKAEVGANNARQQLQRIQELYKAGAAAEQQLDQAQNAYEAAFNDFKAAQAQYDEACSARIKTNVAQSQYDSAAGHYKQAQGALQEAQAYLDNTVLYAPISGYITAKMLNAGEMLNAGTPVLQISDLRHTYATVFIDESKIGLVKLGQQAEVRVDGYPDMVFQGRVVWISDAGQFAVHKAVNEQHSHDIRSFEVKIDVPNPQLYLKVGMTARVAIMPEGN